MMLRKLGYGRGFYGLGILASSLAFGQTRGPECPHGSDTDTVLQIVGCTETQWDCAQSCSEPMTATSIFAPETCNDWFHKGRYICFCRIPSPD